MDIVLTREQIRNIVQSSVNQRIKVNEQDAGTDPSAQQPSAGTSQQQAGGKGYPEVGKWESGIERGPANQIAISKWSDVVGSKLQRGKANQLKEQSQNSPNINSFPACVGKLTEKASGFFSFLASDPPGELSQGNITIKYFPNYVFYKNGRVGKPDGTMGNYSCKGDNIIVDGLDLTQQWWNKEKGKYETEYEKKEIQKAREFGDRFGERVLNPAHDFYQKYNHEINMVLGIGLALAGGPFGLAASAAIGFMDAEQYEDEGDPKTASLMRFFAALPIAGGVIGKLVPGAAKLGPKAMSLLAKSLRLGKPVSQEGAQVVSQIAKNRAAIQAELNRLGQEALKKKGVDVSIPAARKALEKKIRNKVIKKGAKSFAGTTAVYGALGYGHGKVYDYRQRKEEEKNIEILKQKLGMQ